MALDIHKVDLPKFRASIDYSLEVNNRRLVMATRGEQVKFASSWCQEIPLEMYIQKGCTNSNSNTFAVEEEHD
jgi:hypothetical protein